MAVLKEAKDKVLHLQIEMDESKNKKKNMET